MRALASEVLRREVRAGRVEARLVQGELVQVALVVLVVQGIALLLLLFELDVLLLLMNFELHLVHELLREHNAKVPLEVEVQDERRRLRHLEQHHADRLGGAERGEINNQRSQERSKEGKYFLRVQGERLIGSRPAIEAQ